MELQELHSLCMLTSFSGLSEAIYYICAAVAAKKLVTCRVLVVPLTCILSQNFEILNLNVDMIHLHMFIMSLGRPFSCHRVRKTYTFAFMNPGT